MNTMDTDPSVDKDLQEGFPVSPSSGISISPYSISVTAPLEIEEEAKDEKIVWAYFAIPGMILAIAIVAAILLIRSRKRIDVWDIEE
ncbi:MAG: hypothetical protein QCI82_09925 [Candidatus Thermoplasmatota archaeon]|nr:hypothetical protein [Candidatus Thermoplasmatota archaeon]